MRAFADRCQVLVDGPDAFEPALKRFLKGCRESGIFTEMKKREFYMPPSVRRRAKAKKAAARRGKAAARLRPPSDVDWKPERS